MSTIVERPLWDIALTVEIASVVIRASELGYSPWRVGIALRIAPMELAWICAHLNEQDARRHILGATSRVVPHRSILEQQGAAVIDDRLR